MVILKICFSRIDLNGITRVCMKAAGVEVRGKVPVEKKKKKNIQNKEI